MTKAIFGYTASNILQIQPVIAIFRLLISPRGRMKINNFLHSQSIKIIITPARKKYYSVDIYHADKHIDTINVTPNGYTSENKTLLK